MREFSAGFVLFRRKKEIEFLLIRSSEHAYWGFPKGLIDEGEDELEAALRELKEETGINKVQVVEGFRSSNKYFYTQKGTRIFKTVTYFLAEALSDDVELSYEHSDYVWADGPKALGLIPYKSLREVLEEAIKFLREKGIGK